MFIYHSTGSLLTDIITSNHSEIGNDGQFTKVEPVENSKRKRLRSEGIDRTSKRAKQAKTDKSGQIKLETLWRKGQ
jgi:hypothetical protein